ncbi:glucan biosynthesis protein D [Cronobacter dublinensis]|uniref:Glucans biosynthesis protein D n=1 Tax=Cronobacter dublinensis 1210 TaxID=1208656 RepID=A0ABP1WAS7_9ENTR|nr:glucan biosynthesis protein [Cronobacter dublinensis]EGT5662448.1 glucan biosynthesis protein D [Cronobacter dublinensis subsp. dublinensis]CCJ82231.1 Glucans biosynthesis protein D precursor [Cronobacter dublinensis 1210]ALB66864.1 glucan biosynthesis protein D [Cronobacter dublinensis subsp. dublinensis LMG 23823]EGT5670694.1 glucan biosynthesis protein D [Cronobacter dublinensis subsp. dublinensis]EGT5674752.1 glucan biosynthesis protein D [Cronobacter dublinensis subsp. dublinensis]
MNRRRFIKASLALAAACGTPGLATLFSRNAWAQESGIADGQTRAFDFSVLQSMAADLADKPWGGAPRPLPNTLATLTPQAYNSIQYDAGHSLWNNLEGRQLDVQFFHVGMGFRRRVRMFSLDSATRQAREVHFRPELFNYHDAGVDTRQLEGQTDLGFAGFRAFKAPELARRDIVSFLGASYFRAVDSTYQYGLSARGLAVDTFTDTPEEFPDFTAFWFETPKAQDTTFVAYALLDSPSVTGAYKFIIHCEASQVIMEVENFLFARKDIKQLGIAPMTSMFSCGNNERRMCDTIHPQIHDSDRLAMWRGNGEWVCRPLNNPQRLQFNAFMDENPKGFGLLQTDHKFESYQDVMGWYNKRPSLWVEPRNRWGKGTVALMEIPTTGETLDNIVCFWQPEKPIRAGDKLNFQYRLYWSGDAPVRTPLARVYATRTGMGSFPEGWAPGENFPTQWSRRVAVDFVGGDLKGAAPRGIEPVITLSSGEAKQVEILYVEPFDGYRIQFDWYPTSDSVDPVEMRMFLRCQGEAISETWLWQYFPPAPDKRKYVDDRQMR